MIVFVSQKHAKAMKENGTHFSLGTDIKGENITDISFLAPNGLLVSKYLDSGNQKVYESEYFQYLNKPVNLNAILSICILSSNNPVFIHYSSLEKELGYPKLMKNFITDYIGIPKNYVVKWSKWDSKQIDFPQSILKEITDWYKLNKPKVDEIYNVLN